ncbi:MULTISPECIES: DegT/DnrJ/EryC1/StrS aminotransferase family protein [unclassified Flavobacterium]|uniref:DegT/DnrJ/EryC1/StrS family aminotransferase n=1 Tax=unclassified Flavobacterium TaxID=196869 RepID=UPI0012925531|nr:MULTISPECIES: DegT/DnrJ/EryC1/StrS family aminotransferase [unclassified Flavobacterium]MQP52946.1 aminotransferase class V-fold PLP-dependent enzyme [Flavobacterium sp. LMO9]MQP63165.1 aminotransferase class V-fold PLP-dependent enzyme [Flavobacterium sp. LMO6]
MIHFLNLKKINQPFEVAFQNKMKQFLEEGWYVLGNEVKQFETNFAHFCGTKHCIGVGNGLDALILIFKAYIQLGKLQKGDEVIVPANTYIASILAVLQADLVPVLVEPRLETYNINPNEIEAKITSKTKAILPVHLYGQLCEMDAINEIAKKHNLLIIEDAAQAHGARFSVQCSVESVQSNADCHTELVSVSHHLSPNTQHPKAYSFYPGKNLGALGDAGAITTNDDALAEVLYQLRNYGSKVKYENEIIGVNSRLDELQASFLNIKLKHLEAENDFRRSVAKQYLSEIKNDKITLPSWDLSKNHVFHLFVIRTSNRTELKNYLYENGIETMIHYPIPPHKQNALSDWNTLSFPITEKIHDEVLSIPLNSALKTSEVDHIITILNKY